MAKPLYLEDLYPGQVFTTDSTTLDAAAIAAFAREYDPQPFHLSEEGAKGTLFGSLAASGWQTAAISMRLITGSLPIAGGVIGAGGAIKWPRATRPGDTLRVVIEVTEVKPSRSRPERGTAQLHIETLNQNDEPVQVLDIAIVVPRRMADALAR